MENIINLFSDDMIYALGWTVIHSLWQASLVALFMSYILNKYQNKTSVLRYRVAVLSLFIVLISSLATFIIYYDLGNTYYTIESSVSSSILDSQVNTSSHSILGSIGSFFEKNLSLIVLTWMFGCVLFLLKLIGGIVYIKRLVTSGKEIENNQVNSIFNKLVQKLRFKKGISLLESAKIQTPMMLGHLKPVILFPIGLINNLEIEEVEAILAHEISHIYRNDYLVNLIQSLVEVLFYYHPAVWWISANIKAERENCCDDLAVKICGNKLKYASALIKLKELEINSVPSMAIPFSSNNENLFNRIKRIFDQPQNKSNMREKMVMIAFLLSSVVLFSFGKKQLTIIEEDTDCTVVDIIVNDLNENIVEENFEFDINIVCDTIPKKNSKSKITIEKEEGEKNIILKLENGKIDYLEIDGKEIPKKEYDKHMKTINELKPLKSNDGIIHAYDFDGDNSVFIYADSIFKNYKKGNVEFFGDDIHINIDDNFLYTDSLLWKFKHNEHNDALLHSHDEDVIFKFSDSFPGSLLKDKYLKAFDIYNHSDSLYTNWFELKNNDSLINDYNFLLKRNGEWLKDNHFNFEIYSDSNLTKLYRFPNLKIAENLQPFIYQHRLEKGKDGSTYQYFGHSIQQEILSEMVHDGLIKDDDKENEIELSGKHLKINGKKMPKELWQKYKRIYEESQGIELNKKSKIVFKLKLDDRKRLRIRSI